MSGKFRRYFLKTKEAKNLLEESLEKLRTSLEQILKGKVDVEVVETEFAEIFLIDGKPLLAKIGEKVFPTLFFDDFLALASRVVVDMGAVPHVCNGANIMAPGIRRFEGEFRKDDFVLVVDEKHGKSLAVGEVLFDIGEAKRIKQGIVVRNVHFVGDKVWDFIKKHETNV